MPTACAAYGCNNKFGPDTKERKITFHLLPLPADSRRKLWISNSRRIDPVTRQPWNPSSKYVYFCSDHFMPSDFENPFSKPTSRKLKENAVPTLFTFPTVLPPSPVKPSVTSIASETPISSPADDTTNKNKSLSRSKKSKHRKVVMLPKKIKLLQETSTANVESVTIISFQHLDYDEKMQPIFEKVKLDLQYSDESECEPEEEDYFDDQYTDLQNSIPLEEEELIAAFNCTTNEKQNENSESMELSKAILEHDKENLLEQENQSEQVVSKTSENVDTTRIEDPEGSDKVLGERRDGSVNATTIRGNQLSTKDRSQVESGKKKHKHKRKIPVVIKELILIDDIEELRIKAFRIAEDNIKLKRQVIYLEKKLEDLVSQLYTK